MRDLTRVPVAEGTYPLTTAGRSLDGEVRRTADGSVTPRASEGRLDVRGGS
jgi:hexosaminidase